MKKNEGINERGREVTEGCNDKPNEKMNQGEPHYNEQSEGIMMCDGVSSYVCVLQLCVCVCVSRHKTLLAHTRMRL